MEKIILSKLKPGFVIVDDYRLGFKWQKKVSRVHNKVICFDDMQDKKHYADYIINYNPRNYPKILYPYENNKKKNAIYLIHPKYNIISKTSRRFKINLKKFNITFYIGGGGDLKIISDILKSCIKILNESNLNFFVVVGPFSKNKTLINKVASKDKRIKVIENNFDLSGVIASSSLFISSSGTGIFESAAYNISTILFKTSKNQESDTLALENLSHYFYLDKKDLIKVNEFTQFIKTLIINFDRIKKLKNKKNLKIDGLGAKRIVSEIEKPSNLISHQPNKRNSTLKNKLNIRKVIDKDINHYLISRNLKINRKNSISNKEIDKLDHYNWWFSNSRNSYLLKNENDKILYFYDEEVFTLKDINYRISGWFACSSDCGIKEILFALNWQRNQPNNNFVWLSFINKHNKMSQQLSRHIGWKEISSDHEVSIKIQEFYKLNKNKYVYYIR